MSGAPELSEESGEGKKRVSNNNLAEVYASSYIDCSYLFVADAFMSRLSTEELICYMEEMEPKFE